MMSQEVFREGNSSHQVAEDALAVIPATLDATREVYGVVAAAAHRDESRRIVTPKHSWAIVPVVNHCGYARAASADVMGGFKNHAPQAAPSRGEEVAPIFIIVVWKGLWEGIRVGILPPAFQPYAGESPGYIRRICGNWMRTKFVIDLHLRGFDTKLYWNQQHPDRLTWTGA